MIFKLFPQPAPGLVKGADFGKYIKGLVLLGNRVGVQGKLFNRINFISY